MKKIKLEGKQINKVVNIADRLQNLETYWERVKKDGEHLHIDFYSHSTEISLYDDDKNLLRVTINEDGIIEVFKTEGGE